MILVKTVALSIIALIGFFMEVSAFNEKEYARLFVTRKCLKCDLYMAPLSGIDHFTGSNLIAASFQKATLYGAILDDANVSAANFEGALWIDGRICQKGSIGRCIFNKEP